jgi:hypothetical protein
MIKKILIAIILCSILIPLESRALTSEQTYGSTGYVKDTLGRYWVKNGKGTYISIVKPIAMPMAETGATGAVVKSAAEVIARNGSTYLAKNSLLSTIARGAGSGLIAGAALGGVYALGEMAECVP